MSWPNENPTGAHSWGTPLYIDGSTTDWSTSGPGNDFTKAIPTSLPVLSSPFPSITAPGTAGVLPSLPALSYNAEYELKQKFIQFRINYVPLALNTPHKDYTDYYLQAESERSDMGGGLVQWTRTYYKVPPPWYENESYGYNFIGLLGAQSYSPILLYQRNRQTFVVNSRVLNEYFLVDTNGTLGMYGGTAGSGNANIESPDDIPFTYALRYCDQIRWNGTAPTGPTYGGTAIALDVLDANSIPSYGWLPFADLNSPGSMAFGGSNQSAYNGYATYEWMMQDAIANGWNATVTSVVIDNAGAYNVFQPYVMPVGNLNGDGMTTSRFGGVIPVDDGRITRVIGNLWTKKTRYILCQ